jgi:penicillin-insensitive murein endopeptidase
VALPERTPGFLSNPRRTNATAFYGTAELVDALVEAARVVDESEPGGTLVVNDIGFREGGPIDHHGSHQAGRDVDVLFYLTDPQGHPIASVGAPIDPNGEGTDYRDLLDPSDDVPLRIDLSRTWRFIEALLTPRDNSVQRMFIVEHLRTLLLQEAQRRRAPRAVIRRFEEITCQPSYAHDDHIHIRFFCSADDIGAGCADGNPMYPWRNAQLDEAGVDAVMEQRPRRRRSRIVTEAEVRENAPPMHASVRTFLDWRETWTTQPHPGRTYCR